MTDRTHRTRILLDVLRAPQTGRAGLERRQQDRLAALVAHARAASGSYRERYRGLPTGHVALADLPTVTKPELMAEFDDWVTDPGVTREGVEAFVADPARVGTRFRGEYYVCSSSGTTGHPGLFVHDRAAVATYQALTYRLDLSWLSGRQWLDLARRRLRWAAVIGTGGHFAGEGWMELERSRSRWRRKAYRVFSAQRPLADLVAALNTFDPGILTGYPSVLELLAEEQAAGRLRVRPVLVELAGESTSSENRARVAACLGGALHEAYAASEFSPIAVDCAQGWLHVNSDVVLLEPVDADRRPTPAGEPSATVLLTNLVNRVQPIIRYDLGDSVQALPEPCACGSPLPAIRVSGRRDDVLRLRTASGSRVPVPPLAIGAVLEAPAVRRSQVVQAGPTSIRVHLEPRPDARPEEVWRDVTARLRGYLTEQGLGNVEILRGSEPPRQDPRSGKFRQVIGARGS